MRAAKTNRIQASIQASIAVTAPSAFGVKMVKICKTRYKIFHLWDVGDDGVEDVDQDKEEGDEEGHPARDDVHRDEKGNPGDNHKQSCTSYWIWKQNLTANASIKAHCFLPNFAGPNSRSIDVYRGFWSYALFRIPENKEI